MPLAYILPIEKRLWDAADELREFELEGFQEDTQAQKTQIAADARSALAASGERGGEGENWRHMVWNKDKNQYAKAGKFAILFLLALIG